MRTVLILAAFVMVAACAQPETTTASIDADVPSQAGPIQGAVDGRIDGQVGETQLASPATQMAAYDDGHYVSIETVVEFEDQAVMTLLSVSNAEGLFLAGNSGQFLFSEQFDETNDGPVVTMLGCVGDRVGVYNQYDAAAGEVNLTVNEPASGLSNEVDVSIQARWFDRDEQGEQLESYREATTTLTLIR